MARVETSASVFQAAALDADDTSLRAIVYSYYKAVNDSRWHDVVAYFHDEASLHIPGQDPKVGHEAIREFYVAHGRHMSRHNDDVLMLGIEGNRVLTLVDHNGVSRDGVPVKLWTAGSFVIDAGRFRQYRVVFDTFALPEWMRRTGARREPVESVPS